MKSTSCIFFDYFVFVSNLSIIKYNFNFVNLYLISLLIKLKLSSSNVSEEQQLYLSSCLGSLNIAMTETSFNNGALNTQQSYIPFSFGVVSIKLKA